MPTLFRQKLDRRSRWITVMALLLLVGGFSYLFLTSSGTYLPAWFTVFMLALLALLSLSIPRSISVAATTIEINCLVELTLIELDDIKRVEPIDAQHLKWFFPLPMLGMWGIFGYYGYYFDLRHLKTVKLYAAEWRNFVLIEKTDDKIIIVSCSQREHLVSLIRERSHCDSAT